MKFRGVFETKEEEDYRGDHRAPGPDGGAPMHDLQGTYPEDIYSSKGADYYGHGGDHVHMDHATIGVIQRAKGKPNRAVPVYRAVPKTLKGAKINNGDWVTPNRDYAHDHGTSQFGKGKYKILSDIPSAKHLYTDGNSIHEWGYHNPFNEETVPINNVGDGKIAGCGIGPEGTPAVPKKRKKKVFGDLVRR
jgi:hypothetical protein